MNELNVASGRVDEQMLVSVGVRVSTTYLFNARCQIRRFQTWLTSGELESALRSSQERESQASSQVNTARTPHPVLLARPPALVCHVLRVAHLWHSWLVTPPRAARGRASCPPAISAREDVNTDSFTPSWTRRDCRHASL